MATDRAEMKAQVDKIFTAESSQDCLDACTVLAKLVVEKGLHRELAPGSEVISRINEAISPKSNGIARESGLLILVALCRESGTPAAPFLFTQFIEQILNLHCDKGGPVRVAASMALEALMALPHPATYRPIVFPCLLEAIGNVSMKPAAKIAALSALGQCATIGRKEVAANLEKLLGVLGNYCHTTFAKVNEATKACLSKLVTVIDNEDFQPLLPKVVDVLVDHNQTPKLIKDLASTTFVAEVQRPVLSLIVPVFEVALRNRSQDVLFQTVTILNNFIRLIRRKEDSRYWLPRLYTKVADIAQNAAFPDVRSRAAAAESTLLEAVGVERGDDPEMIALIKAPQGEETPAKQEALKRSLIYISELLQKDLERALSSFQEDTTENHHVTSLQEISELSLDHVRKASLDMEYRHVYDKYTWIKMMGEYLWPYLAKEQIERTAVLICSQLLAHYRQEKRGGSGKLEPEEDTSHLGEELCDCFFSLAYGSKLLLHETDLTLHKGRRYGIVGPNGAGKSTLMRAISEGLVDGFPSPDVLKVARVEGILREDETNMKLPEYALARGGKKGETSMEEVETALCAMGFEDDIKEERLLGSLSGGRRMRMDLAIAVLMKADLLLLDEPTNHLDVASVEWLKHHLLASSGLTCLIISHDAGFLEAVCTDIISYENKKLKFYHGGFATFLESKANYKAMFEASAAKETLHFTFPSPGLLTGIKSRTRAILKLKDIAVTYKEGSKPSLQNVSASVSLSSRIGIVGPNGAGKSTLIKVLTGEIQPFAGTVWKHPNLRLGYIAQHAFHHLEEHLDESPSKYLRWRYDCGEDKEVLLKVSRQVSAAEKEMMDKPVNVDGDMRQVETLLGRQKLKRSYRYEVKWKFLSHRFNTFMAREELEALGFGKLIQRFDDHEASREGLGYRELVQEEILKHYDCFGLENDLALHKTIRQLSSGQRVKVVIAAAMWNNPHILVMDEPTNFLDRDSLDALAGAIHNWNGAIVLVSHSDDFMTSLATETWMVENGRMIGKEIKGSTEQVANGEAGTEGAEAQTANGGSAEPPKKEDELDSAEEEAKVQKALSKRKPKKMSRKQVKEQAVRRRQRFVKWLSEGGSANGTKPPSDSESD